MKRGHEVAAATILADYITASSYPAGKIAGSLNVSTYNEISLHRRRDPYDVADSGPN